MSALQPPFIPGFTSLLTLLPITHSSSHQSIYPSFYSSLILLSSHLFVLPPTIHFSIHPSTYPPTHPPTNLFIVLALCLAWFSASSGEEVSPSGGQAYAFWGWRPSCQHQFLSSQVIPGLAPDSCRLVFSGILLFACSLSSLCQPVQSCRLFQKHSWLPGHDHKLIFSESHSLAQRLEVILVLHDFTF